MEIGDEYAVEETLADQLPNAYRNEPDSLLESDTDTAHV